MGPSLAIVARLVVAQHGVVRVESEEGKGSASVVEFRRVDVISRTDDEKRDQQ